MKNKIRNIIRRYGYDVVPFKSYNNQPDPVNPWETDELFLQVYRSVIDVTLVDRRKLYMLWQLTKKASLLPGDIAECGVYKGGTALLLAKSKPAEKKLHLFDTFDGMPPTDAVKDYHKQGDFSDTSFSYVQSLFQHEHNIIWHKGFFPDTAKGLETQTFSLIHCDMDIYSSVLDCCTFFYPLLAPGGMILFDDYGAPSCPGAKQAVEEFCASMGIYEIYLTTGQAIIFRY